MADIRINALTEASASVTTDFLPIDGSTGTRKLSAFSPTFGGNATVTGNLTVNTALSVTNGVSANELTCTGGYAVLRGFGGSADTGALYLGQSTNNNFISSNLTTMASYIANTAITSTVAAGFRVLTTTASTSTSTGALVVGNGTSGGLGVGGAINAGATITTTEFGWAGSISSNALSFTRNSFNYVNLSGGSSASLNFQATTATANDTSVMSYNNTRVAILTGTASNNYASGALQVTGGVGVSGAIFANGNIQSNAVFAANSTTLLLRPNGASVSSGQLSIDTSGNTNAEGIIGTSAASMRVTNTNGGFLIYKDATPTSAARFTYNTAAADTISLGVYNGTSWTDPFRLTATQATLSATSPSRNHQLYVTNSSASGVAAALGGAQFNAQPGYSTFVGVTGDGTSASYQGGVLGSVVVAQQGYIVSDAAQGLLIHAINNDINFATGNPGVQRGYWDANGLRVENSTASTGTSSGALVVSGGVGVAGAVNVGTYLKLSNASQNIAAWGDIGPQFSISGSVLTDTTSSGTVPRAVVNSIASTAIAASSATTYTQAATLFIAAAPTANTNVTITHGYALYTAGGRINFQGLPTSSAGLQAGTLWNDGGTLKVA